MDEIMALQPVDTFGSCLDRIRKAWNAGDARAYAGEFTDDATYIIFLGDLLIGREAIERNHVPVFSRWQHGTKMVVKPVEVRQISDDAVSVVTIGGVGKGARIPFDKLQTFTFVSRDGRWFCAAFQNTLMSRASKRALNSEPTPDAMSAASDRLWRFIRWRPKRR